MDCYSATNRGVLTGVSGCSLTETLASHARLLRPYDTPDPEALACVKHTRLPPLGVLTGPSVCSVTEALASYARLLRTHDNTEALACAEHQTASTREPWRAHQAHQTATTRSSDRAVSLLRHGSTGITCQTAPHTRQHRGPGVRNKHARLPQHGSPGVRIKHTRLLRIHDNTEALACATSTPDCLNTEALACATSTPDCFHMEF